jgi:GT2 family glycosyltransferase
VTGLPTVSVVVPTHARPESLVPCLTALARQTYPADRVECIVVDDGSPDRGAVEGAVAAAERSVRLVRQARSGPGAARNAGASAAGGDLLAFVDDDCRPHAEWIARLVEAWRAHPECCLGGRVDNALTDNIYATASQLLVSYLCEYYNRRPDDAVFFTSNNMAVARRGFVEVGGFHRAFDLVAAEDREFCHRWRRAGRRLMYVRDAVVEHAHDLSFGAFLRQHRQYGRGAERFRRVRKADGAPRLAIEPLAFYLGILRYPLAQSPRTRAWRLAGLMASTQVAGAVGFALEVLRPSRHTRTPPRAR